MQKLIKITQLSKILNLVDAKTKKPLNHVLRYWEKEFTQIKPIKINNQRYYSSKDVEILRFINFLLKVKKMTIKGAKEILKLKIKKLDGNQKFSLKNDYYNEFLKTKSKSILNKVNKLKNYGKKNSSKSTLGS